MERKEKSPRRKAWAWNKFYNSSEANTGYNNGIFTFSYDNYLYYCQLF